MRSLWYLIVALFYKVFGPPIVLFMVWAVCGLPLKAFDELMQITKSKTDLDEALNSWLDVWQSSISPYRIMFSGFVFPMFLIYAIWLLCQ